MGSSVPTKAQLKEKNNQNYQNPADKILGWVLNENVWGIFFSGIVQIQTAAANCKILPTLDHHV